VIAKDRRVEDMDRNEKKRLRDAIGERLDVSNARLRVHDRLVRAV